MAWTWLRPEWLYALAVPFALLLTAALPARPVDVPVGAIALWRRIAANTRGERRRRRPPLELLCVVVALVGAVLALARPVTSSAASVERWQVVVDTSPSCALPWNGGPSPRLVVAAEALAAWAHERSATLGRTIEFEWLAHGEVWPRRMGAADLPNAAAALLGGVAGVAVERHDGEPDWLQHDRGGVLWLTDCVRHANLAGVFASGGAAVPGPIGEDAGRAIVWGPDGTLALGDVVSRGSFVLQGAVPLELTRIAELFGEERRLELVRVGAGSAASPRLTLRGPSDVDTTPEGARSEWVPVGRDGWRARARGSRAPTVGSDTTTAWLADSRGRVWCGSARGLVAVDFVELAVEPGCEAAFAASWAALFDGALLPPAGCVPYDERQACGSTVVRPPATDALPPRMDERRERAPWLGTLAALAAGLALLIRSRR
jgi:hypothetical protein